MKKKQIMLGLACFAALNVGNYAFASDNPFATVPQSTGYYEDVAALVHDGLIDGYTDADFNKNRPITRYEMAMFTAKAMSKTSSANAADTQKIQKLMKEFQSELTDMHVKVPGVKAAKSEKAAKNNASPKIKKMPNNYSLSGMIRMRYDWGPKTTGGKKVHDSFGGTSNHQLLYQLNNQFDIGAGWKGELDIIGAKDGDGDKRTTGENTVGSLDINKAFVTGPLFGTTARIGRTKGSMVYKNSMIMGQYYQGIDLVKSVGKLKTSLAYGRIDYNSSVADSTYEVSYGTITIPGKKYDGKNEKRGVSSSDMNPDGLGVNMTELQFGYQAAKNLQLNASWWHLMNDGGDSYWDKNKDLAYPNPHIGEIGFDWQATKRLNIIGHYAQSSIHGSTHNKGKDSYTQGSDQNKAYALTFKWDKVMPAKAHSHQFQLDLIHQERYTGIKSSFDLKNKAGEGQRGFIADYRYVPVTNVMLDFRWMHYHSMGEKKYTARTSSADQYRVQLYYYF